MTAVSKSTMVSIPYTEFFGLIDTRSNIADPRDADGVKNRTFVYDAIPFVRAYDFNLLPYIVFELPMLSSGLKSVDGSKGEREWEHRLIVRSTRHGSSNSYTDVGRSDMLSISDDLLELFNDVSKLQLLRSCSNLRDVVIEKVSSNVLVVDGKDIFEAEFRLSYATRMVVSS